MTKIIENFLTKRIHHGLGMAASGCVMAMFPYANQQEAVVFTVFSAVLMAMGLVFLLAAAAIRLNKRQKNG